ncbi:MAG: sugar transporter subunit [Naasia sp.]|nr:sugar transporter subunit [Naasia sp.]
MRGSRRGTLTELVDEIRLHATAVDRFDAVRQCGDALVASGAVDAAYVESMLEREHSISTHIGEGVAIPHGTSAGKDAVRRSAMVVLGFPDGIDWDGQRVFICIGIAAPAGGHVALVARLAEVLLDADSAARLRGARTPEQIRDLLGGTRDE